MALIWQDAHDIRQEHSKGDYLYYMLKEISEQPVVWRAVLEQDREYITAIAMDILRARDVIWGACGTSRYAAVIGRYLISSLARKFSEVIVGSELHYFASVFNENTLLLAVSQSGETADVLNGAREVKEHRGQIVSIINRPLSMLEKLSDKTVYMKCGPEVGVAATKSFIATLCILYQLAFAMAGQYTKGMDELSKLDIPIEAVLKDNNYCDIVNVLMGCSDVYYVAKGINYAIGGECALKLKEVSYVHAESMSAGELKHGSLALISNGVPVIGICPNDVTWKDTIANLHEAKSRGGYIIGISDKPDDIFDVWMRIPEVPKIYYPILVVIVGQLIAYHTAVARGFNPDKPRNLAKSVTVP